MMNTNVAVRRQINSADDGLIPFWQGLARGDALRCPVCKGRLSVSEDRFTCRECEAKYPVSGGVPLLMRPDEVVSVSDQVMKVFNIGSDARDRVEAALTTLTRFRTPSHPEFANFFARFDAREGLAQPVPMTADDTAAAVAKVSCVTSCFPETLRSDQPEFRSLRIRNGSDRVLFTDERNPLYISYKLFTPDGSPVAFDGHRSPLPCPLRPESEYTVPVLVRLPEQATGSFVVRFFFVWVNPAAPEPVSAPHVEDKPAVSWLASLRDAFRPREPAVKPVTPAPASTGPVRWLDPRPFAEMTITATRAAAEFPARRRGSLGEFDVHQDVALADAFVADIIRDLKAKGVAKPRVLEIGAGVHSIALRAADEDTSVVVSDISLVMQQLAAIMHAGHPAVLDGRAGFTSFDMMYPPFAPGSFDVVCICAAFHHIPLPNEFLRKLVPLLSADGRFVAVREPCLVNPFEPTYIAELSNGFNEQMFELPEWQAILADGGMTLDQAVIDFGCSLKFSARAIGG